MSTIDDLREAARIRDLIVRWDKGTVLQAGRALDLADEIDTDIVEIEVHTFVVVARDLARAVTMARGHAHRTNDTATRAELSNALKVFNKATPGLVKVRNMHEHFDTEDGDTSWWWEYGDFDTVVNVKGYRVSVESARDAARVLADEALAAFS